MSTKPVKKASHADDQYIAVSKSSLLHRKAAISDVYIQLAGGRMLKIAHKGGAIDVAQLERYGDKNIKYFYVLREDLAEIASELVRGAEMLSKMPNVPADLKLTKFFNISEAVFSEVLKLPLTDDSLHHALVISQEIANNIAEIPDFSKIVSIVVQVGEEFAKHSMATVIMANLLAKQLDWESPKILSILTFGAFFHDIGMKELPPDLSTKERIDLTQDEITLYETHCTRGVHILNAFSFISADVLRIVQEHHELPNGQGFPNHLRGERIYPPAKVVSFASQLAHDIFGQTDISDPLARVREKAESVYNNMYGSKLVRCLKKVFIEL